MRVLFLAYRDWNNPYATGGDIYLAELAKGLAKLGHQVTFLASSFLGSKQKEFVEGVEVIRISGTFSLPLRFFRRYMEELCGRFDVVVEEVIGGQRPPFMGRLFVKEPLVAIWHQKHDRIFREQYPAPVAVILLILERFLSALYRTRTVVTPSHESREKLTQLGLKLENIQVVYDGIRKVSTQDVKACGSREDIVVFLGKLRRYKRVDHIVLALKRVVASLGRCRLIVAGKISEIDRGYVESLRKLILELGLEDHVEFRINISEQEKFELLKRARLLVQPSPVEGFSVVAIEANCCGTPVVVSDGVPSDVVINGYNGLVYPFGGIDALSEAIVELISDDEMWTKMSNNALLWASKFNWERSTKNFAIILKNLIRKGA